MLALVVSIVPVAVGQDEADTRRVEVELEDEGCPAGEGRFCVLPSTITVNEGRTLLLEITNGGEVRQNLTAAPGSPAVLREAVDLAPLEPNGTATLELAWEDLEAARGEVEGRNLTLSCGFDGHADLGETVVLTVGEAAEEQPQPGVGVVAGVAAIGVAALVARRRAS